MLEFRKRRALLSLAALATWGALGSIQLGWVPWARHAWGYNLWQYFPTWTRWLLASAALAFCSGRVRDALLEGGARLSRAASSRHASGPAWLGGLLVWAVLALLLWTGREQRLLGDSQILIWHATDAPFLFPDVGASFVMGCVVRAARRLSLVHEAVVDALQGVVCAVGALALLCVWRAARYLTSEAAGLVALLIVSGGFLRVFAGHVEVYAFVLAAAGAFLWSSLAFLAGRGSWKAPCITLGLAVWLHPSALALVPSLLLLLHSAQAPRRRRRLLLGLGLASLPWVLFLAFMLWTDPRGAVQDAWQAAGQVLGTSQDPTAVHRWVRGWGGEPGAGTDYLLLRWPHLKYLANSAHLLCAWAMPVLLVLAAPRPSRLLATPTARFLSAACLPLLAYALLLRPVWGPFDWDLFSITALFLAALSAHLLATVPDRITSRHAAVSLVGFNLLFVGLPLLLLGFAPALGAGPFATEDFDAQALDPTSPRFPEIAPWL